MVLDPPSLSPTESGERRLLAVVLLALAIKLALAAVIPLSADESYYWVWSKHLDFGYFDHPPMVAWLFALGKIFEPLGAAVRWPAVLLGHGVLFLWLAILKDHLTPQRRLLWLGLFLACPLTGLGGIVVTPDLPLLFFWSLALFFVARLLKETSALSFTGLGAALGLGFCAKYHIVLLPLSLLALVGSAPIRQALLKPGLFLTFLTGLLFCGPVLGWNAQHDWESFTFQLHHGLGDRVFNWMWPVEYFAGELALLFPPLVWLALRPVQTTKLTRVLQACAFLPLGFFFLTSFRAPTELNWPLMAFPAVFALAAARLGRKLFWSDIVVWSAIQLFLVVSIFLPTGFQIHDKLTEPVRFKSVADLPKTHAPLYASSYQIASSLWFVSGVPVYKLRGMSRVDMFDRWPGSLAPRGVFFLLREQGQPLPEDTRTFTVKTLSSPAPGLELLEVTTP